MSIEHGTKITASHRLRKAFVYVRQSSMRQLVENTESTRRQYDLHQAARDLGWPSDHIVTIDSDQGQSGASHDRSGFKKLVAEVGLGHAGIVLGLEVSRLARNSADWHHLLEICALTQTLISDEGGVYDPAHFNDRLLLGLKGTMSEAELYVMRARLRGGALNKARRGELACPLPVGLVYDAQQRVVLDPDVQVQDSVRLVFRTYERVGSAYGTAQYFKERGLLFPKRIHGGPRRDELEWSPLHACRAVSVLRNPRYAGAFAYGRERTRKRPNVRDGRQRVPREQWLAFVPDAHPGYITWARYESIGARLRASSRASGDFGQPSPREGSALLQGLLLCGACGRRMRVRYRQRAGRVEPAYWCMTSEDGVNASFCTWAPGAGIDDAVGKLLLQSLTPMAVDLALAIEQEIGARAQQTDRLRLQQVERARYEADLARRRYMQVDPDHRIVAASLEKLWNDALRALTELQNEHDRRRSDERCAREPAERERLRALGTDLAAVWHDPNTAPRDRKRIARLLIEDVTFRRDDSVHLLLRFRGGATETLTLPRLRPNWQLRQTDPTTVARIDALLATHTSTEIATILNQEGRKTGAGLTFTVHRVNTVVHAAGLKTLKQRLIAAGLCTTPELARRLGVDVETVRSWQRDRKIDGRRCGGRGEWMYHPDVRPMHANPRLALPLPPPERQASCDMGSTTKGAV